MVLQATDDLVEIIAMILLPVAILMCGYALLVFVWRAQAIAKKQVWPSALDSGHLYLYHADPFGYDLQYDAVQAAWQLHACPSVPATRSMWLHESAAATGVDVLAFCRWASSMIALGLWGWQWWSSWLFWPSSLCLWSTLQWTCSTRRGPGRCVDKPRNPEMKPKSFVFT